MKRSCGEASKHHARAQTSRDYLTLRRTAGRIVAGLGGVGAGVGADLGADERERGAASLLDLVSGRCTVGADRCTVGRDLWTVEDAEREVGRTTDRPGVESGAPTFSLGRVVERSGRD
jgi:hypothetical protein